MAAAIALSTTPLHSQESSSWDIPVYLVYDHRVPIVTLQRAQSVASQILASTNVRLKWLSGSPSETKNAAAGACAPPVIKVDFSSDRRLALSSSETLAFTFPYAKGGPRIHVLYDHMAPTYRNSPRLSGILLGYILAHEITHVLQRIDRHSNSGVMKARWTTFEYSNMENGSLRLAEEDVLLIRLGLESWRRLACPAEFTPTPVITAHGALP
jgi:hypothetical protein